MTDFALKHRRGLSWVPGIESIDFQKDDFGKKLEYVLQQMKDDIDRGNIISDEGCKNLGFEDMLENVIYNRTGIRTSIDFASPAIAAIMPFYINRDHVLAHSYWRGVEIPDQQKFLREFKNKKGSVDLAKARVDGIFSEYHHYFHLNVFLLFTTFNMSPREVVAVMLHEIGHAFTWYELGDRLMSTNRVLTEIAFEKEIDPKKREYALRELCTEWGMDVKDMEDIQEEDNRVIFGFRLFKKFVKVIQSQLKNCKYDETSSEQLADNFAARFGYGRELISALEHFYILTPERSSFAAFTSFIIEFLVVQISGTAALIVGIAGVPELIIFGIMMMFLTFIFAGEEHHDYTYDRLKLRYKRIRDQYIEMIDKAKLTKEELTIAIGDVHAMDSIIKDTRVFRGPSELIANFCWAPNRSAKEAILLQQLLEELAHNDLFLKAAEMKVLS